MVRYNLGLTHFLLIKGIKGGKTYKLHIGTRICISPDYYERLSNKTGKSSLLLFKFHQRNLNGFEFYLN